MKYLTALVFAALAGLNFVKAQKRNNSIKTIVVAHALEQSPEGLWYPWIKEIAATKGLTATIPQLPNPQHPELKSWEETIGTAANISPKNTILIGHSLGCTTLLHFLNNYNKKEKFPLLLLVAPTIFDVGYESLREFFSEPFQLSSLQNKVDKIIVIVTPTDPVLKPDPLQHGLKLVNEADAKLLVIKKGNHFWNGDDLSELKMVIYQEIEAALYP